MVTRSASTGARSVPELLAEADAALRAGESYAAAPVPTGFWPLDPHLGGGLRPGELTLLCGLPGLGKTLFALQAARNVVTAGGQALVVSYEHGEHDLLERLLALEVGLLAGFDGVPLKGVREALRADGRRSGLVDRHPAKAWREGLDAVAAYGDRLQLLGGASAHHDLEHVRGLAAEVPGRLVVVDYLQKVRPAGSPASEDERVTVVVEGLKDLALETGTAVLAVVAAGKQGFEGRTRVKHLRGSTALAYEADVILMLNDKFSILARHHLMYGAIGTERFHDFVVCTIEKNRGGADGVELEFRKHFDQARFDPLGAEVAETLVDDRVHVE